MKDPQELNDALSPDYLNVDYRRILYRLFKYWYVIALCLILGFASAFLINRYTTKKYHIEASIIIKESDEVSGGELLYNNPLIKFYKNYLNELYIIKSRPLIKKTVEDLGLNKIFYQIGELKTSEIYKKSPFEIDIIENPQEQPIEFTFEILDQRLIQLNYNYLNEEFSKTIEIGQKIKLGTASLRLVPNKFNDKEFQKGDKFKFTFADPSILAFSYINRLKAEWAEEGAGVINLSINGALVDKEMDFLNQLILNYQQSDLDKKNIAASNAMFFIEDQLNGIKDTLNDVQNQLTVFKNQNLITDLNSEAIRLYTKLEGFEIQKTELILKSNYYDYLTEYLNKSNKLDQIILPSSLGLSDEILNGLMAEMVAIQTELKIMARFDDNQNPIIESKKRRLDEIKKDIIESIENQKSIDDIKNNLLNKNILEIEKDLKTIPIAEQNLVNIKRRYTLLENLYTFLLQKRAEAGISKATNVSDIVTVNPPMMVAQVTPKNRRNYLVFCALGLALPIIFFILMEIFNSKVQSKEDVEQLTTIPFIGGVGHMQKSLNLEVLSKPKSAISESFRVIRSNLFYFLKNQNSGVILVTSSISGEGKTFSSINLASVLTMSGRKALIIGADMRKPKIFNDFQVDNSIGLSNFLSGFSSFEEVVRSTGYDNLDLISGGPIPPNPSELMMSDKMDELIKIAKEKYDYVVIDSPPLALVTDAMILSQKVDHTIFIVRQDYTPQPLLSSINDYYTSGKISKISILLNDIFRSGIGYGYGYSYGYNFGYGSKKNNGSGYYE